MKVKTLISLSAVLVSVAGHVPGLAEDRKAEEVQEEQGEEAAPRMSDEEIDRVMACLDEHVPEIEDEWAGYIEEQEEGEAHLRKRMTGYRPYDVYRDYEETEYLGKYYLVSVEEEGEYLYHSWEYFYVSEDCDEVLWYDKIPGCEYPVLYLDEWRNSEYYRKLDKQ